MVKVRNRFKKAFVKSKLSVDDVADLLEVSAQQVNGWLKGGTPYWTKAVPLVRFIYTIEQAEAEGGLSDSATTPRWYKLWWEESASKFDDHELLAGWSRLAKIMSDMGVKPSQAAPWVGMTVSHFCNAVIHRTTPRLYYDPLLRFAIALQAIHDAGGFTGEVMNEAEFKPIWERVKKLDLPTRQLARSRRISNTPAAG